MSFSTPLALLTEVVRSSRVESRHLGAAVIADPQGRVLASVGDPKLATYLRSAAKPFQLLAMIEMGLEGAMSLDGQELAVCAASHGGEEGHVLTVRRLLSRSGLDEALLQCGGHWPLEDPARDALLRGGLHQPLPVHNNCSGKHTAMLLTCVANGWPLETYLEADHPLQARISSRMTELAGELGGIGVDGCGVPTFYHSLVGTARAVATLMVEASCGGAAGRVVEAMTSHPWYTSGTHRLGYLLMKACPGLLAKEGAEGFFAVGIPSERSPWGVPVGLALKVLDGAGEAARGREPAVASALLSLGVVRGDERDAVEALAAPSLCNVAGRVIGEIRGVLRFTWS